MAVALVVALAGAAGAGVALALDVVALAGIVAFGFATGLVLGIAVLGSSTHIAHLLMREALTPTLHLQSASPTHVAKIAAGKDKFQNLVVRSGEHEAMTKGNDKRQWQKTTTVEQ